MNENSLKIINDAIFDLKQYKNNTKALFSFWNFIAKTQNPLNYVNQHFLMMQNESISEVKTKTQWEQEGVVINSNSSTYKLLAFYKTQNDNINSMFVDVYDIKHTNSANAHSFDVSVWVNNYLQDKMISIKEHSIDILGCYLKNDGENDVVLYMHTKYKNTLIIKLYYVINHWLSSKQDLSYSEVINEVLMYLLAKRNWYSVYDENTNATFENRYLKNFAEFIANENDDVIYGVFESILKLFYELIQDTQSLVLRVEMEQSYEEKQIVKNI